MPYYCAIHPNYLNGDEPCPQCASFINRHGQAHAEGVQACKNGVANSANPYMHKGDGAQEMGWRAGWYAEYYESNPRPPSLYYKQYDNTRT